MSKVIVGLGALLLALVLSLSGVHAVIDFDAVLHAPLVREPVPQSCRGADTLRMYVRVDGALYSTFLNLENRRVVIVKHLPAGDPEEVAFGSLVVVGGRTTMQVDELLPAGPAMLKYPSPCDYLAPQQV